MRPLRNPYLRPRPKHAGKKSTERHLERWAEWRSKLDRKLAEPDVRVLMGELMDGAYDPAENATIPRRELCPSGISDRPTGSMRLEE